MFFGRSDNDERVVLKTQYPLRNPPPIKVRLELAPIGSLEGVRQRSAVDIQYPVTKDAQKRQNTYNKAKYTRKLEQESKAKKSTRANKTKLYRCNEVT